MNWMMGAALAAMATLAALPAQAALLGTNWSVDY